MMLKVKPKTVQSATSRAINIVGINARFINEFPVSVRPIQAFSFYIEYVMDDGDIRDRMNATSDEFLKFLMAKGMEEQQAQEILTQVFGALLVGTREQRYEAISSLVSFYGYELLPIEKQD